jgi:hypothetical protein
VPTSDAIVVSDHSSSSNGVATLDDKHSTANALGSKPMSEVTPKVVSELPPLPGPGIYPVLPAHPRLLVRIKRSLLISSLLTKFSSRIARCRPAWCGHATMEARCPYYYRRWIRRTRLAAARVNRRVAMGFVDSLSPWTFKSSRLIGW